MSNPLSRRLRTTLFYALRTAFRLTPMPQGTRDRLRQRFLDTRGHWVPEGPKGQAPTGDLPRRPYVRSDERAIGYVPYEKGELPDPLPATLVAFYLPQFHTIPENDEWWGKGFTEWRNVTRALPQFEGHYQPRLPGDLGFYDLRNVEVMHEQARLAREYGISAFCFYFYWFGGKTLLETPLRNWLNDKTIDLKFCLCWANEKWTRTWDGRGDEILIDQKHSPEDDIAFIEHVAEYMRDPRYLRVDGKPMLLIYRPGLLPDPSATTDRWRRWCRENGIGEIHLSYVQSFEAPDPRDIGCDAGVEFPPNLTNDALLTPLALLNTDYKGSLRDWRSMSSEFMRRPHRRDPIIHRGVNPSWDNEARRPGAGRTLIGSSPRRFRDWIENCIPMSAIPSGDPPLVFVNAWNEWAEGAVIEPDAAHGYAWLHATRTALNHASAKARAAAKRNKPIAVVIHAWYADELKQILDALLACNLDIRLLVTTSVERAPDIRHALGNSAFQFEIVAFDNRGRDVLPFLSVLERLIDMDDVVLKLHTKRSPHRADGARLRTELLSALCDPARARDFAGLLSGPGDVGMVACKAHYHPVQRMIGANQSSLERLSSRLEIPFPSTFPAGSMYWLRSAALQPLLDLGLRTWEFEAEEGQIDGTLAHAIERVVAQVVETSGYTIKLI
ncbi:glycoside hydrolase family 99-like domain-containing protein [Pseudoxanthomonas mexicana]